MTLEQAKELAAEFSKISGFCKVEVNEFGFCSRNYRVLLWMSNSRTGNRDNHQVNDFISDKKEIKAIAKAAKDKFRGVVGSSQRLIDAIDK